MNLENEKINKRNSKSKENWKIKEIVEYNTWNTQPLTKLRSIKLKKNPTPWSSSSRTSRHEEIIVSRLRIGYIQLTHSYLLLGLYSPPSCRYCHADEINIPHFFKFVPLVMKLKKQE